MMKSLLSIVVAICLTTHENRLLADSHMPRQPNVVLILVDNFGSGDLGCYGSTLHRTPHVDQLAKEGTKFTSFYVASGVCTPSRAALLTGCYPRRIGMHVSDRNGLVLQPLSSKGLHPEEDTLADVLRRAGYATGIFGKWHLGDQPEFLPTRQGFDEFFGIPYSDDMTKDKSPELWPELPLMRGDKVIEAPADRNRLVKRTTEEAIAFIERSKDRPFLAYIPHTMPGSTTHPFSSDSFRGKSKNGEYGDSVEELDWSTGEIMASLKRLGLDENTLVIWTSDNGAVRRNPPQGSNAPYRGHGYDCSEGAMRMPCIMRWPGKIPSGNVQDALCSTIDLLPTIAAWTNAPLSAKPIDGHDIRSLLTSERLAPSPWDEKGFCFYRRGKIEAVRAGPWKLYLPVSPPTAGPARTGLQQQKLQLYDVRNDKEESQEAAEKNPDVVKRLLGLIEITRAEIGDEERPGKGQRDPGHVAVPKPLVLASAKDKKPNVVFILTDNQGAWTLGCYGNKDIRTPNIDKLAAQGMRFTRALSSNPVCSPTRATFLTGLIPSQHGLHSFLDPQFMMGSKAYNTLAEFSSMGEILQANGYVCGLSGKWHLGDNLNPSEGFTSWVTKPDGHTNEFYDQPVIENGKVRQELGYTTDLWTRKGIEFIEQNRERPFFLYLAYNGPYSLGGLMMQSARNRHADFYRGKHFESFPDDAMHPWQFHNKRFHNQQIAKERVAAETSGVDDGVGQVMATLDRLGLTRDTLVVYAADQGWMGGQNGLWGMGDHTRPIGAHELMMQIPFVFHHPGMIPEGATSDLLLSNYDFLPSVLGYFGLADKMPTHPKSPGRDFSANLRGQEIAWDNCVYYEMDTCRAVRTNRWKLVLRHPDGPHELYDMQTDPQERFNQYGQTGTETTKKELQAKLHRFFEHYADPQYDLWRGGRSKAKRLQ
ncbi:MAG: sulfatase-like hydrolase/transferase [Pirellula sp.]